MENKKELTVEQKKFLTVFKDQDCNISEACKAVNNMPRETYYDWMKNPEFACQINDAKEGLKDYVESQLMKAIENGDEDAIMFFLGSRAQHRGYRAESKTVCTVREILDYLKHLQKNGITLDEAIAALEAEL